MDLELYIIILDIVVVMYGVYCLVKLLLISRELDFIEVERESLDSIKSEIITELKGYIKHILNEQFVKNFELQDNKTKASEKRIEKMIDTIIKKYFDEKN